MKPIRHILLSLAALACVLPTSAQTARKTKTCTASDMVLIYAGGARNRNWSVDRMKDYVSYTDRDGKAHWLFDGFLLLEIRDIGPAAPKWPSTRDTRTKTVRSSRPPRRPIGSN